MMRSLVQAGLLGAAAVLAHPHPASTANQPGGLRRRTVDLEAYRLAETADYVNAAAAAAAGAATLARRDDYVDAATALLRATLPSAEYRLVGDHYVGANGIAHVNFKQTANGLDIDNADFNVNVAADGSIFSYGNSFFAGALPASPLGKREFGDPVEALRAVSSMLELGVDAGSATAEPAGPVETYTLAGTSGAVSAPEARLVYFAGGDGGLVLAWRVETDVADDWLLTYVDAATSAAIHGVVNYRSNIDATYLVYPWGVNDPSEGSRAAVASPWDLDDSEFTWLGDGTSTYDTTRGNNGVAQVNPSGSTSSTAWQTNYRPESAARNFSYAYAASLTPPAVYRDASVAQLFYTANMYHDLLYELGFTEAAGNFEADNNGQGGAGGDFVILNAQDGAGTNNADFSTPPDGQQARMRMYIWTESTPHRDCAFEAGVVIHEYTHGLSTRLTGGPANSGCLSGTESGGMGEGWGDFMATAVRLKAADTAATDYVMGAWVYDDPAGIRAYPFSTSLATNPYTYASANALDEVHAIGTIWATVLYELLWALVGKHGLSVAYKPTFDAAGVPTDGKFLAMKLVTDAMALQPCGPNMVQARDAIVDADAALTGGANACEIWTAFAKRGLGEGAVYARVTRTEDFTVPSGVC